MIVSWVEVPCNGRNGPITGYYLTYTNITSNTSYTVNITGGNNTMYTLTGLISYTNYTVSIIPYNYDMTGPARQAIQLTPRKKKDKTLISLTLNFTDPGVISGLTLISAAITNITISWKLPNNVIIAYKIRYRESTSTGPYNITNTTNTQYSIVGLIPNTSYTIGVRAYTSVGPGEWTDREFTSTKIRKNFYLLNKSLLYSIAIVKGFLVTEINSTAVRADWGSVTGANHFTVYYQSTSKRKRQTDTGMRIFPGDTTNGVIGGLDPSLDYLFSISVSYNINGITFEGQRSQPIPPGMCCTL